MEELRGGRGRALTSSEPSRQLSCPSHRRLAETQPPLAHTYSLREHVGRTEQALVNLCVEITSHPLDHWADQVFVF